MRKLSRVFSIALSVVVLTSCSSAPKPREKEVVVPDSHRKTYETFRYAPAMRAGDLLFLSGVVVQLGDGETEKNIVPAIERAFEEIELILGEAGGDWSDVVDVTSYLTDLDAQITDLWQVKQSRVPAPYPTWSAIGVDRLFGGDGALIEIKVTAYLPQ